MGFSGGFIGMGFPMGVSGESLQVAILTNWLFSLMLHGLHGHDAKVDKNLEKWRKKTTSPFEGGGRGRGSTLSPLPNFTPEKFHWGGENRTPHRKFFRLIPILERNGFILPLFPLFLESPI